MNQATDRAIIHWDTFSIGAGNTTTFVQPSSTSAVLNRVVTGAPSELLGTLNANGRVYLINPNGIMVGPSGVVNANRFVASTLDVANGDFLGTNGMVFGGNSTEKVINQGTINTGTGGAYLFSRQVVNEGTINSDGNATLAAGYEILLKPFGGPLDVEVVAGVATAGTGVDQKGAINAVNAQLETAWGNPYSLAINQAGTIRAKKLTNEGGQIWLRGADGQVIVSGTVNADANGVGSGGKVDIRGSQVALVGSAKVTASTDVVSADEAGSVYVEGYENVYFAKGSEVKADGVNHAGVVTVTSKNTVLQGEISALASGAITGAAGRISTTGSELFYGNGQFITRGEWTAYTGGVDIGQGVPDLGSYDSLSNTVVFPTGGTSRIDSIQSIQKAIVYTAKVNIVAQELSAGGGNINVIHGFSFYSVPENLSGESRIYLIADNNISIQSNGNLFFGSDIRSLDFGLHANANGSGEGRVSIDTAYITTRGGDFVIGGGVPVGGDFDARFENLKLAGYAETTTEQTYAVWINKSKIHTESGDIVIRGYASGDANIMGGVGIFGGVDPLEITEIINDGGKITIEGVVDGKGGDAHRGILLSQSYVIGHNGGPVVVNGLVNDSQAFYSAAVEMNEGFVIAGGNSPLTLDAHNYATAGNAKGLVLNNGAINAVDGDVYINTSAAGDTADSVAFEMRGQYGLASYGKGNLTVDARGFGFAKGIDFQGAPDVKTDIFNFGEGTVTLSAISENGKSITLRNLDLQGNGDLVIQPLDYNVGVGLGDGATGRFHLENGDLDALYKTGYDRVVIGHANHEGLVDVRGLPVDNKELLVRGQLIEVNGDSQIGDGNVTLHAYDNIYVYANMLKTWGAEARRLALRADNNIWVDVGTQIRSTSGALDIVLNSDRDANQSGTVVVSWLSIIDSNGGRIELAGGNEEDAGGWLTGYTWGNGEHINRGIYIDGSLISRGGDVSLRGKGSHNANSNERDASGIYLQEWTIIDTTGGSGKGDVYIEGHGGYAGADDTLGNDGVSMFGSINAKGDVYILGYGADSPSFSDQGIYVYNWIEGRDSIRSQNGNIALEGYGIAGGGGWDVGVMFFGEETRVIAENGYVYIFGEGGDGVDANGVAANYGVLIENGASIKANSDVTIEGVAGSAEGLYNTAVSFGDVAQWWPAAYRTTIESLNGSVFVTGFGAGTGADTYGIYMQNTSIKALNDIVLTVGTDAANDALVTFDTTLWPLLGSLVILP